MLRERERERLISGITNERTNNLMNIGKDEQQSERRKLYTHQHKRRGGITSVDIDI